MRDRASVLAGIAALLVVVRLGFAIEPAHAAPATLTLGGTINGSVDGTALTDATPFTVIASFAPSTNLAGRGSGVDVYPAALTFLIDNVAYNVVPYAGLLAETIGPPANPGLGTYGVVIPSYTGPLNAFFNTATTGVGTGGSAQTVFSNPTVYEQPTLAPYFVENLVGGGTLVVTDFVSLDGTASESVPEPGSLALLGLGLAPLLMLRRWDPN